jgi:phage tail-like protein
MSVAPDGCISILDSKNKSVWKLDRELRVKGFPSMPEGQLEALGGFQPVAGACQPPQQSCVQSPITSGFALSLAALSDVVAVESLPDGSVLILENPAGLDFSVVHRFQAGIETAPPVFLDHALALYVPDANQQALRAYDFAFLQNSSQVGTSGVLYFAEIEGNQTFAFDLLATDATFSLTAKPQYFPMRHFVGKGLVATGSAVYYDFQDTWVPLSEQPRKQYQLEAQLLLPQPPPEPDFSSPPVGFDGKLPGCVWHRLFLDACIQPGASVQVESRAADLTVLLPSTPWRLEPTPYLRGDGPEIPFYKSQLQGPPDRVGTWELLFQRARGRYLQLRVTLRGTGRTSPRLHALRVYYPRFSYLHQYLPPVYRDDATSASFLDRFLSNVEGFYTVLEGRIADVQELFDSRLVPAEYLDWLASWVSLVLDPSWSERTRRLVISHAPQMFRERGTPNGIVRAIRLMVDSCPDESLFDESSCKAGGCSSDGTVFSVRLVERFLTRVSPAINFDTPAAADAPGFATTASASFWTPAQGSDPLNSRYRCYLQSQYTSIDTLNEAWTTSFIEFGDANLILPAIQPVQSTQAQDWKRFLLKGIGFTYAAVTSSDLSSYQAFLARRYPTIADLNQAYSLTGSNAFQSFSAIPFPGPIPSGGVQLQDWILFVSLAVPIQQNAHRFTVLVPVTLNDTTDAQQTKLAVAQRVAEIEKPAHTSFDVRLYWGMFRAGEARLGQDTLLGPGSRFAGLVLGQGYLSGGNLALVEPIQARDRKRLGSRTINERCRELRPQERCV